MRIELGVPDRTSERAMLLGMDRRVMLKELKPVMTPQILMEIQDNVRKVHVDFENGSFISAIRLKESACKLCQQISPKVNQEKPGFDGLVLSVHQKLNRACFTRDVQRVDMNVR